MMKLYQAVPVDVADGVVIAVPAAAALMLKRSEGSNDCVLLS